MVGAVTGLMAVGALLLTGIGTGETESSNPDVAVLSGSVATSTYVEIELAPPAATTTQPSAGFELPEPTNPGPTTVPVPEPVTLLFTGDVIAHVAVSSSARTGPGEYDFSPMFATVAPVIEAADLAICHLETPLDPESRTPRGFPRFSVPSEIADALAWAGFDGCSTSSNHVLDRGVVGVGETLDVLDAVGLKHTGSARTPEERVGEIYEVGDVIVGHASYAYAVSGWLGSDEQWVANGLDSDQILADAQELRDRGADFVVVSLHWGIEHQQKPTSAQVSLGQTLIESPLVDLIVGHHAHVLQPVVEIDDKYIFYGLGNFLSNQEPSCCGEEAQESAIMLVRIESDGASWGATELRYVPTWVDRHRDYVILSTLEWDVSEHRHAAWLERSAERVERSLDLEGAALSIGEACTWMGVDCAPHVENAG